MNIVDQAMQLAITYHNGHVNQHNGEAYMLHLQRVYIGVRAAGYSELYQATAWLHDSLEDTELNLTILQTALPHAHELHEALVAMTHNQGESYEEYCRRAKMNRIARIVKRYDMHDNFRRNYLIEDEETRLRMAKKYSLGMDILGGVA